MFDQGAHLTAVLGIESIVDLDEKSQIDALIIAITSLQEDY